MKKTLFISAMFGLFIMQSCVIKNPKPENCVIESVKIIKIAEGKSNDIIISDTGGDHYYINKDLENNLNVTELSKQILDQKVTLHLPKYSIGTSEHVAQLALNDTILYTEFN